MIMSPHCLANSYRLVVASINKWNRRIHSSLSTSFECYYRLDDRSTLTTTGNRLQTTDNAIGSWKRAVEQTRECSASHQLMPQCNGVMNIHDVPIKREQQ